MCSRARLRSACTSATNDPVLVMLLRLLALAKASRSPTAVQSLVFAVTLLARLNTQREFVLARRQWTGRVGGEGAGWVVGPIEIQRHLAVARHIGIEESTASVSLGFVGLVPEDEKNRDLRKRSIPLYRYAAQR